MPELITKDQIKKIWSLAHANGVEEDQLRDLVEQVSGQRSIRALSRNLANMVLNRLSPHRQPEAQCDGTRMASEAQKQKIWALVFALGWDENGTQNKRLEGYLKKRVGVERLDWLTARQACRAIEGLKSMLERQEQANGI